MDNYHSKLGKLRTKILCDNLWLTLRTKLAIIGPHQKHHKVGDPREVVEVQKKNSYQLIHCKIWLLAKSNSNYYLDTSNNKWSKKWSSIQNLWIQMPQNRQILFNTWIKSSSQLLLALSYSINKKPILRAYKSNLTQPIHNTEDYKSLHTNQEPKLQRRHSMKSWLSLFKSSCMSSGSSRKQKINFCLKDLYLGKIGILKEIKISN